VEPRRGSDIIHIPITFDIRKGSVDQGTSKKLWAFLGVVAWIFTSFLVFIAADGFWAWGYPLISFVVLIYIIRFLIIREPYYREKREALIASNYMFPHSVFWDVYEISNKFPYIVHFASGIKGIFIALDKDVIVGKDRDADFDHHSAIANAYQQMVRRGIECIHIDYMDVVGKDTRLGTLFEQYERTENPDLRKLLLRKFDYIEYLMNRSYSFYDVYVFFYNGPDDVFWSELQEVLDYFKLANYTRIRVLNKSAIADLVKSVINISDFSVSRATDNLFKEMNRIQYIRPLWVENNGERTILNKSLEELEELKRVSKSERSVKRKRKFGALIGRRKDEEEIDLFQGD